MRDILLVEAKVLAADNDKRKTVKILQYYESFE